MRACLAAVLLAVSCASSTVEAADLAEPPPPLPPVVALPPGAFPVEVTTLYPPPTPPLDEVMTPRFPAPASGPAIVVPGLNGPNGPPLYPLLPFSFRYGY